VDNFLVGDDTHKKFRDNEDFVEIVGDISDEATWLRAFKYKPQYVINLAGIVGDPACLNDLKRSFKVNAEASEIGARVANVYNVKKFIHASTCSIYGNQKGVLDEKSPQTPVDFYGQTKLSAERLVERQLPIETRIFLRFGTAYGFSNRMRFDLVVNSLTRKGYWDKNLTIFGTGKQRRPFTHCYDLARACVFFVENDSYLGVFNVVGENFEIGEIAKLINNDLDDVSLENIEKMEDFRDYEVTSNVLTALGFEFKFNVKRGIHEIIQKFKNNELLECKEDKYYNDKLGA